MAERPQALVLKFPGTNCDGETADALNLAGFNVSVMPVTQFARESLYACRLLVLAGGFSYGDYVLAGKLAQLELESSAGYDLRSFTAQGGYILGICNGFQILLHLGLLPDGALIENESGRFICKWAGLRKTGASSPFLKNLPAEFELPVAHAEGRFVHRTRFPESCIALRYSENVNGSMDSVAALQDATGRVLGIMPHPERFVRREQHYDRDWTGNSKWGWGYFFFKSIHDHILNEAL
ncbi:MAG: phosphoribosylformylglycinamidine synthase subunit PurQ [Kiritimatiellae bacterium]|nr:phosphoribosylformylglycinamidine synthase subunit PurQ [Kiritimatiellia bacterium]